MMPAVRRYIRPAPCSVTFIDSIVMSSFLEHAEVWGGLDGSLGRVAGWSENAAERLC
jgi:hypothetical protein